MRTKNVAVLVSGGGTNLQAIIDAQNAGTIRSGKVRLVISNRAGAYAIERAKAAGIPHSIARAVAPPATIREFSK